ncbi:MAG: hypothetical protein J6R32_06345 [Bacteroidales bacterium]|nr:hypothetical protein [Bacteroidales bacterium]
MSYFFKKPFAENGDVTQIPLEDQGDGNVSYAEGWPEGYELDPTRNPEDARNLSRTNFNGLFLNITQALQQLQVYGVNPYITAVDNGGTPYPYPEGGSCYYVDPATNEVGVYRSLQSNNTDVPSTNGVTSSLWRREFDVQLDTLKSNRVSNCPLYYPTEPSVTVDTDNNSIRITVYAGTKVLMPKGYDDDNTYKNDIIQVVNNETFDYTFTGDQVNNYFLLTEDNTLLLLNSLNYVPYYDLSTVNNFLGGTTTYPVYYFDNSLNKWQYRAANSSEFVDANKQMVMIGNFTGASTDNLTFNFNSPLTLTSGEYFQKTVANLQTALSPARYITLTGTPLGQAIMDINLPSTATPFCVNYGNLNSSGQPDLLSTQAIYVPNKTMDMVFPTSGSIVSYAAGNTYTYVEGGGNHTERLLGLKGMVVTTVMTASNIDNIFGPHSGSCDVSWSITNGNEYTFTIAEMTLDVPIELSTLGCTLEFDSYTFNYSDYWSVRGLMSAYAYERYYARLWFIITLTFDDNTTYALSTENNSYNNWINSSVDLSEYATAGKKITKISVQSKGYTYDSGQVAVFHGSSTVGGSTHITKISNAEAHFRALRIINKINQVQYSSNQVDFKVGSNYYKKMGSDGTPMLTAEGGTITSSSSAYDYMWFVNNIATIPSYADSLYTEYEFKSTPDETNNARMVIKYIDEENDQILGGLSVELEYWGGVTYTLANKIVLDRTQDLLFEIPDGKYIKKVRVFASQMDYLRNVKIGRIQIYNNVSAETLAALAQYPALQATAADTDRTRLTLTSLDSLVLNQSGYLMLSKAGAYILPGTNVIRKQKKQPTTEDDPALTDGDVWLDYSKEPLMAYQYQNGKWNIFSDVPVGYITLTWGDPSASAAVSGTGITAATVTAATFATQVADSGTYVFAYDGTNWVFNSQNVTLSTYGISVTGTPAEGDTVTITFTESVATVSNIETYPYNQNGYNINTYTDTSGALSGRDGRDGKDGKDGKNGAPGPAGPAGVGIPSGGLNGQLLAKASNASYDCKWTTMASTALFDGGTAGQIIVKNSSTDLDFSWTDMPSGIPSGGTTGQALIKASDTDKDVEWGVVESLPTGGAAGYILTKRTGTDYDAIWTAPGQILAIYDNDNAFMLSAYSYAQANGYSAVTIENFHNTNGINSTADDGAVVLSTYYSNVSLSVLNSSGNPISFRLNTLTSINPIYSLVAHLEATGTVTVYISTDDGTSWNQLSDYVDFTLNYVSSFTIKITLASGASVKNIALITK